MGGLGLPLCLLVWIAGTAVCRTKGDVIAPALLTAEAGHPLLLGCNVTGGIIRQVSWFHNRNKKLLVYEPGESVRISHQDSNVLLNSSHSNSSYITIKSVQKDDEGCYQCDFHIYPLGRQQGQTCVSVTGKVRLDGNKTAVSGKPITLSCWYSLPETVQQVLWRKIAEQGDTTTVASFTKKGDQTIGDAFRGRVSLSRNLADTELTIKVVKTEDEGCYTCEFHTYPDGTKSDTACLSVFVLPKPEINYVTSTSGVTEANCTAQSRPAAEMVWNVDGDNRTLGPPMSSTYNQGDGTTIVTSTLLFQSALLNDMSVKCIVHHEGLKKPLSVSLNKHVSPAMVILLSVCGVAAVLLLCVCVCLCKCFICTDD
ncbi:OX-2 membrane glycoprotein-like [Scomber scombrus]|uniref:OX-2 membrane glycoprotein-like n=1 Tax=Scomber scombrus TaxID=13677 RepID=A0AAV1Q8L1_SCOSC|nr:OX-2 membrane glycoprotein-like [Scomber scombrus]